MENRTPTFFHIFHCFRSQLRILNPGRVQITDHMDVGDEENHILLTATHRQAHEIIQIFESRTQDIPYHGHMRSRTFGHQIIGQIEIPHDGGIVAEVLRTDERRFRRFYGEAFR